VKVSRLLVVGLLLASCAAPAAALPPPLEAGRDLYRANCSTCHGVRGQGLAGPALAGVTATFPDCDDQLRWISLGSEKWKEEVGPTYGAQDKAITSIMPGFEAALTDAQIAEVAAYQRSAFGEADPATAMGDCGL
jgi:mono/diheme cytochrome c family protein